MKHLDALERGAEIYKAVLLGETYRAVAARHRVSAGRCQQIFTDFHREVRGIAPYDMGGFHLDELRPRAWLWIEQADRLLRQRRAQLVVALRRIRTQVHHSTAAPLAGLATSIDSVIEHLGERP